MTDDIGNATARMMDELERDPIFLPSDFWRSISKINIDMIRSDGIENFKKTVSQNYLNFLVTDLSDPQFSRAFADAKANGIEKVKPVTIERDVTLRILSRPLSVTLTEDQRNIYGVFVSYLWENMIRTDRARLHLALAEPDIGNPIKIWREGKLISQDLANSILECNMIIPFIAQLNRPSRIAEIGTGSGRLAHVFSATQRGTYHLFDIPPALYVAQWYLSRVMSDKKVFLFRSFERFEDIRGELEDADIAFFSANQLRKFPPGYFDVIQSISTLPEMRPDQVSLYLGLFQSLSNGQIYLKQLSDWKNPQDGTHLGAKDYMLGKEWTMVLDEIDLVNPIFFNKIWNKNGGK